MADDTPIKYIVLEKSLIGNELFEAGAEVTLPEGTLPAENLKPTCARGEAKHQEYIETNKARIAKMNEMYGPQQTPGVDMAALGNLIAQAVTAAMVEQKKVDEEHKAALAAAMEKIAALEAAATPTAPAPAADAPAADQHSLA